MTAGPGRSGWLLGIDDVCEAGYCKFEFCALVSLFALDVWGVEADREGG
jgi:hypothetical protein